MFWSNSNRNFITNISSSIIHVKMEESPAMSRLAVLGINNNKKEEFSDLARSASSLRTNLPFHNPTKRICFRKQKAMWWRRSEETRRKKWAWWKRNIDLNPYNINLTSTPGIFRWKSPFSFTPRSPTQLQWYQMDMMVMRSRQGEVNNPRSSAFRYTTSFFSIIDPSAFLMLFRWGWKKERGSNNNNTSQYLLVLFTYSPVYL